MRRALRALGVVVAAALLAAPAGAVNITLSGPTTGPLTGGVGVEDATGLGQISFEIGLSESTAIAGYDLSVAWDATEVALVSAQQLFPGAGGFLLSPVGGSPDGARAAVLGFVPVATTVLFRLTFDVLSAGVTIDGAADMRVFVDELVNGPGFSPEGVVVENPLGAGIDLVHAPEPATGALLALALAALAAAGRRR